MESVMRLVQNTWQQKQPYLLLKTLLSVSVAEDKKLLGAALSLLLGYALMPPPGTMNVLWLTGAAKEGSRCKKWHFSHGF